MKTYVVRYQISTFLCKALISAFSKKDALHKFTMFHEEKPTSICLLDEDENIVSKNSDKWYNDLYENARRA